MIRGGVTAISRISVHPRNLLGMMRRVTWAPAWTYFTRMKRGSWEPAELERRLSGWSVAEWGRGPAIRSGTGASDLRPAHAAGRRRDQSRGGRAHRARVDGRTFARACATSRDSASRVRSVIKQSTASWVARHRPERYSCRGGQTAKIRALLLRGGPRTDDKADYSAVAEFFSDTATGGRGGRCGPQSAGPSGCASGGSAPETRRGPRGTRGRRWTVRRYSAAHRPTSAWPGGASPGP